MPSHGGKEMRIIYIGEHSVVKDAVADANRVLRDEAFLNQIASHSNFDMSTVLPAAIADLIRSSTLDFVIKLFSPHGIDALRYRNTFAYTDDKMPNTLFLNEKKLNREVADVAATIIHEGIHALDEADTNHRFGHGNNSPRGKENTAPYWIGNRAYQILTQRVGAAAPSLEEIEEDRAG
jgi:hypothetical protein